MKTGKQRSIVNADSFKYSRLGSRRIQVTVEVQLVKATVTTRNKDYAKINTIRGHTRSGAGFIDDVWRTE